MSTAEKKKPKLSGSIIKGNLSEQQGAGWVQLGPDASYYDRERMEQQDPRQREKCYCCEPHSFLPCRQLSRGRGGSLSSASSGSILLAIICSDLLPPSAQ